MYNNFDRFLTQNVFNSYAVPKMCKLIDDFYPVLNRFLKTLEELLQCNCLLKNIVLNLVVYLSNTNGNITTRQNRIK